MRIAPIYAKRLREATNEAIRRLHKFSSLDKEKPVAARAYFSGLTGEEAGKILQMLVETKRIARESESQDEVVNEGPEEEAPAWPADADIQ